MDLACPEPARATIRASVSKNDGAIKTCRRGYLSLFTPQSLKVANIARLLRTNYACKPLLALISRVDIRLFVKVVEVLLVQFPFVRHRLCIEAPTYLKASNLITELQNPATCSSISF